MWGEGLCSEKTKEDRMYWLEWKKQLEPSEEEYL